MAVTLRDVAESAGVSLATASRALNGRVAYQVAQDTRERIWGAVRLLGYKVTTEPRSAISDGDPQPDRDQCVGLILDDAHDLYASPFWIRVLAGIEQELIQHRYHLLFSFIPGDLRHDHKRRLVSSKYVDGLIFAGRPQPFENDICAGRIVAIDSGSTVWANGDLRYDYIGMEERRATYDLVDHLINLGRRRFAYLGPTPESNQRADAYFQRLAFHGIEVPAEKRPPTPWTLDEAYPVALDLLHEHGRDLDAVACGCDQVAIAVIRAAKALGLRLPDDLAIAGFNDDPFARDLDPALTTIGVPKELLGALAVRRLIERIHNPDLAPILQLVPTKLVVRASCGAAMAHR